MTIYIRTDVPTGRSPFVVPSVGQLRALLSHNQLRDDFELMWNDAGNLAVCEPGQGSNGPTRWYIGYIDLCLLEVHIKPGTRIDADIPGKPEQYPFDAKPAWVVGSGHEANSSRDHERPGEP